MKTLLYILRTIYRVRLWLVGIPLVVTLLAIFFTRNLTRYFQVDTTIYTGVASGYSIESGTGVIVDWNTINNEMDNIVNIIRSQSTLKRVSLRLYARCMINGNPDKDNNFITAEHYRQLQTITPKAVQALIDKSSEEQTVANLLGYEQPDPNNFVYGLFNWKHEHYSYEALSKIEVRRLSASDMLHISYVANDPGVAHNTLLILNDEFVKQYQELRFAETNNVIEYFRQQLAETGTALRNAEDSLTDYNVRMKVINYDEQTKYVASLTHEFELNYERILLAYESSSALVETLDERIDESVRQMIQNAQFSAKLKAIGDLTTMITRLEAFQKDSTGGRYDTDLQMLRERLKQAEEDFTAFSVPYSVHKYSKEGVANTDIINQWLEETLKKTKAEAELAAMRQRKLELDAQYAYYSPIGSTIKRKERDINLTEQSYLEILDALHAALMKQKNLQMTSASLRVLNPPIFPVGPMRSARRLIVAGAFFGSLIFVIGFFLILELLDRTLRDRTRAERLTGLMVIGAFLGSGKLKWRGYNKECYRIASTYLANRLLSLLDDRKKRHVVNLISTEDGDSKEFIAGKLEEQWSSMGLNVRVVSWQGELMGDMKRYLQAEKIEDLYQSAGEDVVIVEQPPLRLGSIPAPLLRQGDVNLLLARADRVWKDTDQLLLDRLKQQLGDGKLYMYLTQTEREAMQEFTGMLPPVTPLRKFVYRVFQLGLTSKR